ncbi:MAG: hypothetical protein IPF56_18380 [Chloroflexi bacterium]|nr:hypothetical protein [Chloroflexota bacterium]MBK6713087.1 hypothetical protein [Chloroflexota bacterium]MBK7179519.1 hypothetical protein [Chloroflexota bacterium]MBK7919000.1 hypothetical protein [Chloroflexota bacterium]MBK8932376.1 hypothetical protein [Chloroflexota bacterium]
MLKRISYMVLGALVALAVVFGGFAVYAQTADEGAATATPVAGTTTQDGLVPDVMGRDGRSGGSHGFDGRGGLGIDEDALLAEALGITTDELQTAQDAARTAAIEQAVADGLLTQAQADALISGDAGIRGDRGFDGRHGFGGAEMDTYLAEALGITTAELEAAQDAARAAGLAQAVADGTITQEEADLMAAAQALHDAIDEDAIMADILGVTVEEFQAAKQAHTVQDLVDAAGLTQADLTTAVQAAYDAAVQQAIADGIITQEQADALANGRGFGLDGLGDPRGGHGGRGGHGDFDQQNCDPSSSDTTGSDSTNSGTTPTDTSSSSNA